MHRVLLSSAALLPRYLTLATAMRHCASNAAPVAATTSAKLDSLAASYAQLTLKELSDLQRLVFKKLGHSDDFYEKALLRSMGGGGGQVMMAAAPAAASAGAAAAAAGGDAAAGGEASKTEKKKVEKLTFDIKLSEYAPDIKIKLIKELRTVTSLSIADAKKAVEKCPGLVATNLSKESAEKLKELYEKLGAKVELI